LGTTTPGLKNKSHEHSTGVKQSFPLSQIQDTSSLGNIFPNERQCGHWAQNTKLFAQAIFYDLVSIQFHSFWNAVGINGKSLGDMHKQGEKQTLPQVSMWSLIKQNMYTGIVPGNMMQPIDFFSVLLSCGRNWAFVAY
jgi:hypothetical protein